jgi:hypothetical protein
MFCQLWILRADGPRKPTRAGVETAQILWWVSAVANVRNVLCLIGQIEARGIRSDRGARRDL